MHKGSLPRSIALPPGQIGRGHCPDGLDEAAVDMLVEQAFGQVPAVRRPGWLSSDVVEQRRARRRVRQVVRSLPGVLGSPVTLTDSDEGQVA